MSDFKKAIFRIAENIEQSFDDLAFEFKRRLRLSDPLQIVPYRSYGTVNRLYVKGRVLEDKGIESSRDGASLWNNLLNMYRRFESDEVPNALVRFTFQGAEYDVYTDKEGYFTLDISTDIALHWEDMWHEIDVEIIDAPLPFEKGIKNTAHVLIPPADAEYGIISDIDDTIVKTSATDLLAMSKTVFMNNAHTRIPFAGVSEFYKALQLGRNGKRNNPFFYVSSSPWNLYDLLTEFLDLNQIPPGPLLLRDFGLQKDHLISSGHMGHKFKEIENILLAYPMLNFVLIGDSGQEDPKIYREVVRKYPDRILVVYIRDVQLADRQTIAIDLSEDMRTDKVEMIIVDNTVEAAEHAARIKLIYTEALPEIEEEKKKDKGEVAGKQPLDATVL